MSDHKFEDVTCIRCGAPASIRMRAHGRGSFIAWKLDPTPGGFNCSAPSRSPADTTHNAITDYEMIEMLRQANESGPPQK